LFENSCKDKLEIVDYSFFQKEELKNDSKSINFSTRYCYNIFLVNVKASLASGTLSSDEIIKAFQRHAEANELIDEKILVVGIE
jgi:hypothetical protein